MRRGVADLRETSDRWAFAGRPVPFSNQTPCRTRPQTDGGWSWRPSPSWARPKRSRGHHLDSAPDPLGCEPDLQGIWTYATLTPLQRPRQLAGREFFTEEEASSRPGSRVVALLGQNN